jgi:NACalpha-BTF3-like transcription factor
LDFILDDDSITIQEIIIIVIKSDGRSFQIKHNIPPPIMKEKDEACPDLESDKLPELFDGSLCKKRDPRDYKSNVLTNDNDDQTEDINLETKHWFEVLQKESPEKKIKDSRDALFDSEGNSIGACVVTSGESDEEEAEEKKQKPEEIPLDETGVDQKDILLIMNQVEGCSRNRAIQALRANGGDLVNALMSMFV